jgi:ubiquinone/menaquinone biosynthesis C-methylase UbiE
LYNLAQLHWHRNEYKAAFDVAQRSLPVADDWADVVISNGVLNLMPDKSAGLREMARVLRPGGRPQLGDILVQKEVHEEAKQNIDLGAC